MLGPYNFSRATELLKPFKLRKALSIGPSDFPDCP
jgi:hypothetical protein